MIRSQQLKQKIKHQGEIAHGIGNSYADHSERDALRYFLANCPNLQQFWKNYFGTPPNTTLKEDPLGEYGVDLGIVTKSNTNNETTIHGLIEVDVFNSWERVFRHTTKSIMFWKENSSTLRKRTISILHVHSTTCILRCVAQPERT